MVRVGVVGLNGDCLIVVGQGVLEALLIGELLRSAHSEDGGWLGSGEDSTAAPAIGMAEESLAQAISSHGGLGLSKFIVQSMSK